MQATERAYIEVIGPQEAEIIKAQEAAFLKVIRIYFNEYRLGDFERGSLISHIDGIVASEATMAGIFSSKYHIGTDLRLKARENRSLFGLRDWILNLISSLKERHGLSRELQKTVIADINAHMRVVVEERSRMAPEVLETAASTAALQKRLQAKEITMAEQLGRIESRNAHAIRERDERILVLEAEAAAREQRFAELTASASAQSASMDRITSLHSYEDAAQFTQNMYKGLDAVMRQLGTFDASAQIIKSRKDSVLRELAAARRTLSEVADSAWLGEQATACLTHGVSSQALVKAFVLKAIQQDRLTHHAGQARVVEDTLKDAIHKLKKYEAKIKSQWFRKARAGYKRKKPIIDTLIADLTTKISQLRADGTNAHEVLQQANTLLREQMFKADGREKWAYRDGVNFKACIDAALAKITRALDGQVSKITTVSAAPGVDLALVAEIGDADELSRTLDQRTLERLTAAEGLPAIIRERLLGAATCLDTAATELGEMSHHVEEAAGIRRQFFSHIERSVSRGASASTGVDAVQEAMITARDMSARIRAEAASFVITDAGGMPALSDGSTQMGLPGSVNTGASALVLATHRAADRACVTREMVK